MLSALALEEGLLSGTGGAEPESAAPFESPLLLFESPLPESRLPFAEPSVDEPLRA